MSTIRNKSNIGYKVLNISYGEQVEFLNWLEAACEEARKKIQSSEQEQQIRENRIKSLTVLS